MPVVLTTNLTIGSVGPEVTLLQTWLSTDKNIYPEQAVNGTYTAATKRAVERYQKGEKVISGAPNGGYGVVGPITRADLNTQFSNNQGGIAWVEGPYANALALKGTTFVPLKEKQYTLADPLLATINIWVKPSTLSEHETPVFTNANGYSVGFEEYGRIYVNTPRGKVTTQDVHMRAKEWQHLLILVTKEDAVFIYNNEPIEVMGIPALKKPGLFDSFFGGIVDSFKPFFVAFTGGGAKKPLPGMAPASAPAQRGVFDRITFFVHDLFSPSQTAPAESAPQPSGGVSNSSSNNFLSLWAPETQKSTPTPTPTKTTPSQKSEPAATSSSSSSSLVSTTTTQATTLPPQTQAATSTSTSTSAIATSTTSKTATSTADSIVYAQSAYGSGGSSVPASPKKPVLILIGDSTVTVQLGGIYQETGVIAFDGKGNNVSTQVVIGGSTINYNVAGNYTITYDVTNSSGLKATQMTRTVVIATSTAQGLVTPQPVTPTTATPVITLVGSARVSIVVGTVYTDPGAFALDQKDGDISNKIVIGGATVNYSVLGDYTITYDVTDSLGNKAQQVTRTVTVTVPPPLPAGQQTPSYPLAPAGLDVLYSVSNKGDPAFISVDINPLHVYVGDTQILTVKVSSASAITSVTAVTQLDTITLTLPLVQTATDASGTTFSASWVVYDTHTQIYRTTFTATNSAGSSSSITMAWSDPCAGITQGSNSTLTANCTVTAVYGLDGATVTIPTGVTLTLNNAATWAWNPGTSILKTGTGSIAIAASGASLQKGYLFYLTATPIDTNTMYFFTTTPQSGYTTVGTYTQAYYYGQAYYYAQAMYK